MIGDAPVSQITGVPGWESPDEQYELLRWAMMVPRHGTIVEIGAEYGMSASIFVKGALSTVRIVSVDLFPGNMLQSYQRNLEAAGVERGRTKQIVGDSFEAGKQWLDLIDLLFIDGDHTYEGVKRDLDAWMPHVRIGGTVVFHDAAPFTNRKPHPLHYEVQRAINEYMTDHLHLWEEQDSIDSMRIFVRK